MDEFNVCPLLLFFAGIAFRPVPGANLAARHPCGSDARPGGSSKPPPRGQMRPHLSAQEIQTFCRRAGSHLSAPYNTAARASPTATIAPAAVTAWSRFGYSYWRNINNHVGQNEMLIFLGLNDSAAGPRPSMFRYRQDHRSVANLAAVRPFLQHELAHRRRLVLERTRPNTIYIDNGPRCCATTS